MRTKPFDPKTVQPNDKLHYVAKDDDGSVLMKRRVIDYKYFNGAPHHQYRVAALIEGNKHPDWVMIRDLVVEIPEETRYLVLDFVKSSNSLQARPILFGNEQLIPGNPDEVIQLTFVDGKMVEAKMLEKDLDDIK